MLLRQAVLKAQVKKRKAWGEVRSPTHSNEGNWLVIL